MLSAATGYRGLKYVLPGLKPPATHTKAGATKSQAVAGFNPPMFPVSPTVA